MTPDTTNSFCLKCGAPSLLLFEDHCTRPSCSNFDANVVAAEPEGRWNWFAPDWSKPGYVIYSTQQTRNDFVDALKAEREAAEQAAIQQEFVQGARKADAFHVGQRVRCIDQDDVPYSKVGTIMKVYADHLHVDYDDFSDGWGDNGSSWRCLTKALEPAAAVETGFQIGQRVSFRKDAGRLIKGKIIGIGNGPNKTCRIQTDRDGVWYRAENMLELVGTAPAEREFAVGDKVECKSIIAKGRWIPCKIESRHRLGNDPWTFRVTDKNGQAKNVNVKDLRHA